MIPVYNFFMFNGISSRDFEVWISGSGTFSAPARSVEMIQVLGRNGDLTMDNGRFNNIEVTYPAFIVKDFRQNFDAFKAFLCSQIGYKRLEDSYHPEYFRKGIFSEQLNPNMRTINQAGDFEVVFSCDPRRFLKEGEKAITYTSAGTLINRTEFTAKPLIRCYGTGYLYVNDVTIRVRTADGYTDIDSETENCYKGTTSCNANVTFGDDYKTFPSLVAGSNSIRYTGFSRIEVIPRWWTV